MLVRKETAAAFEILLKQINQLCGKNMAYFKIRSYKQEKPSFKQPIGASNIDKTLRVKLGIIYPSLTTHNFRPHRPLSAVTIKINKKINLLVYKQYSFLHVMFLPYIVLNFLNTLNSIICDYAEVTLNYTNIILQKRKLRIKTNDSTLKTRSLNILLITLHFETCVFSSFI